jgi:hypothetical protein
VLLLLLCETARGKKEKESMEKKESDPMENDKSFFCHAIIYIKNGHVRTQRCLP